MSSTAFSNHFVVGYRIYECRTSTRNFFKTLTAFVSEIVLRHSPERFLPHLLMDEYHVLSMNHFRKLLLCLFVFMATYIPSIVLNPGRITWVSDLQNHAIVYIYDDVRRDVI